MCPRVGGCIGRRESVCSPKKVVIAEQVAGVGRDRDLEGCVRVVADGPGLIQRDVAQSGIDDSVPKGGDIERCIRGFRKISHAELRWRGVRRPNHRC
jgi:hypothetical protein